MASNLVKSDAEEFVIQNMSWPLNETRDALSESLFKNLPIETILYIFRFLSVHDVCRVSLVSRCFKMITNHDQIWKPKCNSKSNIFFSLFILIFE